MRDVSKIDFAENVELLATGSESELVKIGRSLADQAVEEEDVWLRSRAHYLAASALRKAERIRVNTKEQGDTYGDEIISHLEAAAQDDHLRSMEWLRICYLDGQSITTPSPEKAEYLKKRMIKIENKVRLFYKKGLASFFEHNGFSKSGKYWIKRVEGDKSYIFSLDFFQHNQSLSLGVNLSEGANSDIAHMLIKNKNERQQYVNATYEIQRWNQRIERLATIQRSLLKWAIPYCDKLD